MRRRLLLPLLAVPALALASPLLSNQSSERDAAIVSAIRQLQGRVTALRGLEFKADVPIAVKSAEAVRKEMEEEGMDEEQRELLASAVKTLALFRLGSPELDLVGVYLDVMQEQLGGYYDPDMRELVLVRREGVFGGHEVGESSEEEEVAAHELVHALQDQHFDLWQMRNRDFHDDDVETAIISLVEGDASYAMLFFLTPELPADADHALLGLAESLFWDDASGGAIDGMPRIMRDNLYFPYTQGLIFGSELQRARGWKGMDEALRSPPMSTEQILHPERYFGDRPDWPTRLELPELSSVFGEGWREVDTNTMGEMGVRSFFHQVLPGLSREERATLGEGWDGDRYQVLEHEDGRLSGVWALTFDGPSDAAEFTISTMRWIDQVAGRERRRMKRKAIWWEGGDTTWALSQVSSEVRVLMDVPPESARQVMKAIEELPHRELRYLDDVALPKDEPREIDKPAEPVAE